MTAFQRRDAPLFAAVAAGLLAVTVALVTALWAESVNDAAREADQRAGDVVEEVHRLTGLVADAETGERGYLLTGRDAYLDAYNRAENEIPAALRGLQQLTSSHGQEASLVANLGALTRLTLDEMAQAILVRQQRGLIAARAVVEAGAGRRLMDEIRTRSQELQNSAEQEATSAASRADRAAAMARTVGFSAGGIALVLLASMLALLVQRQRLERKTEAAERARARLSEQLADAATRDPLTALPNRRLVVDRVGQALHRAERDDTKLALLLLDIDGFAHVNESMGHTAGDILLSEVAERLEAELSPSDTLGRWGGDQFVALCEGITTEDEATRIAERLRAAATGSDLAEPTPDGAADEPATTDAGNGGPATDDGKAGPRGAEPAERRAVPITASVGVVISTHRQMKGAEQVTPTPQLLLSAADSAMHQAKEHGGDCVHVYDRTTAAHRTDRYQLLLDLRRATADAELWLAYQPLVELDTGHLVGLEALVRWQHPARGQIPPADFIPLAEDSGLIVLLGARILRQACERAGRWNGRRRDLGLRPLKMSVNVSARQLFDPSFVDITREALDDAPLLARNLTLEITETALVEGAKPVTRVLDDLAGMGVTLALDDFGTGYSSLAYLRQFPIGLIKIDRSFTAGMVSNDADLAIVRTIIGLAENLERPVLAEGIETAEQAQQLRVLGCRLGQGFCYGRPMPSETIEPMLLQETVLMR
ncbi:MAG: putative bifunctional diguanylate cyclase/phosphodiesterase [Actinomycetes bacterium]